MRISDWSSDVCSSDLSKPIAGRLVIGWSAALLRVTSSTTGLVMSLMVRSPVTFSLPSPAVSTLVLLKVAAGNLRASKKDRKSVVYGKSVSVRVDLGGRRIIKQQTSLCYRLIVHFHPLMYLL